MADKQTITIPQSLILELEAWGQMTAKLFAKLRQAGVTSLPAIDDQAWFWTDEHQAKERLVDEALAQGDYQDFEDVEDLIKTLNARV